MEGYEETFETWNKLASLYEQKFMHLDIYNETYDAFCNCLTLGKAKVLEIGCGPGNITQYLLKKRADIQIHGIDVAPNMIALAQKNNPAATFEVMDSRHINKLENNYDAVICGFCIPYLSPLDCSKLFADVSSILSTNSLFYLSFVEGNNADSGFRTGSSGDRTFFYYHDATFIKSQLTINAFKQVMAFEIAYPLADKQTEMHTVLLAKKT